MFGLYKILAQAFDFTNHLKLQSVLNVLTWKKMSWVFIFNEVFKGK